MCTSAGVVSIKVFVGMSTTKAAQLLVWHQGPPDSNGRGEPVEFFLTPARVSSVRGMLCFSYDLPSGATVYGDKAYCDYGFEDGLKEGGIDCKPLRKKNARCPHPPWEATQIQCARRQRDNEQSDHCVDA